MIIVLLFFFSNQKVKREREKLNMYFELYKKCRGRQQSQNNDQLNR